MEYHFNIGGDKMTKTMEKYQVEVLLKIKRPWKISVRFSFEWKAWLLAYDLFNCSPGEFSKLTHDKQFTAICYGAAAWDRMKRGKQVFFTYKDLCQGLLRASKADNQKLAKTMGYIELPQWLKDKIDH